MASPNPQEQTTLYLTRQFKAPREKVFQAWTEAQALAQWFAPSDDMSTRVVELDLRVSGHYRIEMIQADGKCHCVTGQYQQIQAPEKLVFTWGWDNEGKGVAPDEISLVTVEFLQHGNETEVRLLHERLHTQTSKDQHEQGWRGCLARMHKAL